LIGDEWESLIGMSEVRFESLIGMSEVKFIHVGIHENNARKSMPNCNCKILKKKQLQGRGTLTRYLFYIFKFKLVKKYYGG
jgi:hypothetical protein